MVSLELLDPTRIRSLRFDSIRCNRILVSIVRHSLVLLSGKLGTGRILAISLMSNQEGDTVAQMLDVIRGALPCGQPNCTHPAELKVYDDGHGWRWYRACSINAPWPSFAMHDKSSALLDACNAKALESLLCLWHGFEAP